MIDGFVLTEDLIQFKTGTYTWENAIRESSKELLTQEYIQPSYVEAMIEVVKAYGPYIVIAPNIAMPHARPEAGSIKVGFSVTLFDQPVSFGEDESLNARLFVTLSCTSSDTHLKMMQALVEVLGEEENIEKLLNTKDKNTVLELFQ